MSTVRTFELNIFLLENYDEDTEETTLDDCFTVQPSIVEKLNEVYCRTQWLEPFKLSYEETTAIGQNFSEIEYGTDFSLSLEEFYKKCRNLPERVRQILNSLPDLKSAEFDGKETMWLDPKFH